MNREKIEECYKWDLSSIFSSREDLYEEMNQVKEKLTEFDKYKDIQYDEDSLYEVLKLYMEVSRRISKLEVYVSLLCDEDTSINKNRELKEEVDNLSSEFIKRTYFIEPNILKLDKEEVDKLIDKNEKLEEYKRYIDKMFRYKEHTLSDSEEKLLAELSKTFGNNYETYELMKDSDMVFPNFVVDYEDYELDNSKYSIYIEDDNREVRKAAFEDMYETFKQYKNVYGNLITANIKEEVAISRIKKYKSALEAAMYHDELDTRIYDNLIATINERMNVLHKYYELKKKVLGVSELHLYDVYANLINEDRKEYDFESSKETVLEALSILGEEYTSIVKKGIQDRWIDVYPNKGKRTGGYSSGSYDTNPYVLLNYQDKYDDMSTLAHELGHSMHSYYTRHNNPYQYGHYSIFVAEVASTVNELILAKHVIKNSNNKNEKMFILNRLMELFRATIYRQTMFAEFEKKIYQMIEEDKPVSADILSDEYYKLNEIYFGKEVYIDDYIRYEWERIPHFYYNFYVYKYATGLSAACYIVNGLLDGTIKKEDYISFLKCGDSKSPLESLKLAGVDLSKPEVVEKATEMFAETIHEFEELYFS